jgi:TolB-like protein
MNLFNELKRRNVFRVGIAYLLGAWVLLQGADFALDVVGAPNWIIQSLTILAAIGLPAVLIFSWIFEMTPEGLKRESEIDHGQSIAPQTGRKLDRTITAFLVLAVAVLLVDRFVSTDRTPAQESRPTATSAPVETEMTPGEVAEVSSGEARELQTIDRRSVAVLPFAFRSTNPEDEFFAEGMHDDLLTQLAKIGSLKVISRTSVMEYKDTTKKIPEIAGELGVATIVEGGVQRSGSRVRINAQLIDAGNDEHLWAETFNRELTAENLFEIQAEISLAIANALQATLSPEEQAQIGRVLTGNLDAWASYQRAQKMGNNQSTDSTIAGLTEIDHALSLDPEFAAAYSLKAILLMRRFWFWDPDPAVAEQAWAAIESGRKLDASLPELDIAEGYYHYWGFLDYEKALVALDRAMAVMPNDDRIHQARGYVMRRQGRYEEAIESFRTAAELDPREATHLADIAATVSRLGRHDEAEDLLSRAEQLRPDAPLVLLTKGEVVMTARGDSRMARYYFGRAPGTFPEVYSLFWYVILAEKDYAAAFDLIEEWPGNMLDVRVHHFSRAMLQGMTHHFAGNDEQAQPLLAAASEQFEAVLAAEPDRFTTLRAMCSLQGALGNIEGAKAYCQLAHDQLPNDAFMRAYHVLEIAAGLAMAGDDDGAMTRLKECLELEATASMHDIERHPAFLHLQDRPDYQALVRAHRVKR